MAGADGVDLADAARRLGTGVPMETPGHHAVRSGVHCCCDETYFNDLVFLIGLDPRTYVLLAGQVEESCDGETWGLSLAFDQAREGLQIVGLAEDGAKFYPRSQREAAALLGADFSVPVQKDVWHTEDKAAQTVTDMERIALRKLAKAYNMEEDLSGLAGGPDYPLAAKAGSSPVRCPGASLL